MTAKNELGTEASRIRRAKNALNDRTIPEVWEPHLEAVSKAIGYVLLANRDKYRMTQEDEEDVFQNTWLLLLEHGINLRNPAGYAARVTHTTIVTMFRRKKLTQRTADVLRNAGSSMFVK